MNKSPRRNTGKDSLRGGRAALAVSLTACKTGPDYERPSLALPDGYKSATERETGQPELGLDWWKLFQDTELDALCAEALQANHGLQAAMARVAQARASAASVNSGFYPVISMNPSAMRSDPNPKRLQNRAVFRKSPPHWARYPACSARSTRLPRAKSRPRED